jgi:hypothetical protein
LHELSFKIEPGQKVGIVGATGVFNHRERSRAQVPS